MGKNVINNRYQLVRLLGEGGMGAVHQALDLKLNRNVAIKLITGDLATAASREGRFYREQKTAASIDSPHIAMVIDAGTDEETGAPFMVMEFLEGEDLRSLIHRLGQVPPKVALRIAAQACRGLQKVHEANVIHRDIKPANVFLAKRTDDDAVIVKLLDFGIAKIRMEVAQGVEQGDLTTTGTMLGSPRYMSPEQIRGMKNIDHRADIWSLGVSLYHALTGRTPSHGCESLGEILLATCMEPPKPITEIAPWVPPEVAAVAHGALQLEPSARYQSAAEMLAAISRLLPNGAQLEESMLVPMTESERLPLAPAFTPSREPPTVMMKSATPAIRAVSRPSPQRSVSRVLIVEDNEMNMDMLSRRLIKKGYEVLCAVDGEAGVSMARSEKPDVVLMDVSLPGIDGWEATRRLRADPETADVPIIALTAHATASDREKALQVGCDDYETKPVDLPRLLGKIEKLLAVKSSR